MSDKMKQNRSNSGNRQGGHMAMSMPVEKAKNFKGSLRRLGGFLKPRRKQLILVVFAAVFSTVFSILGPKILGNVTTALFKGFYEKLMGVPNAAIDFTYIGNILLIMLGLYIISSIFTYIQQFLMASVGQKTVYDMRTAVNAKLARLPLKYFDSQPHGDILSRVTNDIDTISTTLQQSISQLITSILTIIGILIMMLTISPLLTLISIVTLPVIGVITAIIAKQSKKYFSGQQKAIGTLNGHVEEMYTGHQVVKVFNHEEESIKKFAEINEELYVQGWKAQFISGIIMPVLTFINNIGYVLVCVIGGLMVSRNTLAIGDIQAFIQYIRQFTRPMAMVANIANIIQSTIAAAERVFEVLDEEEELADADPSKSFETVKGDIVFDNVDFSYKKDIALIQKMNIDVKQGHTIAIVGPTGAGKTTLVNLLMRFYELNSGKITIDGVNITDLKRGDLRSVFGMVLQDTWLFNGTIRDNIAYGRLDATEEEIVEAAKAAHADFFIRALPDGYETILSEDAANISQGEKQLLTIARAILADPAVLILDEATSSVDTRTEVYIQNAMLNLMKVRTSFVIAHRLSTIKNAESILVMNEGSIIEQGNHSDLLEKNGFYAELYNSQFAGKVT